MKQTTFEWYLEQRSYQPKTIAGIKKSVKNYRMWLKSVSITVYKADHRSSILYIEFMKKKHSYCPHTINLELSNLRHYYNYLQTNKSPFHQIRIRGRRKTILLDLFKEEELRGIYKNLPHLTVQERRVKVLAGFYLFQGLTTNDISHLTVSALQLSEGRISIPISRRANARILALDPLQMLLLIEEFGNTIGKEECLIYQCLSSAQQLAWVTKDLHQSLKSVEGYKSLMHIRHSVVMNWLKRYNLRRVQYNAGHRYISTTEKYKESNFDELKISIVTKHPLG